MMLKKVKLGVIAVAILLITGVIQTAEAYPLPTLDLNKLLGNARIVMNQVQEIKAEIESTMQIVKEIQHGGYGAAVNDLFGKIENGDFDRFGNRLKTIKSAVQDSSDMVKDSTARTRAEEEARKKGMSEAEAKKYADEQVAKNKALREERRLKRAEEQAKAKANGQKSGIASAYNWLKDNRSTTTAIRSGATAAQNGNWGGVASSALAGVGSTMSNNNQNNMEKCAAGDKACEERNAQRQKNSNTGNLLSGLAGNTGNAVNAATSGNWGGVASSAMAGVGGAMNTANQNSMENCAAGDEACAARNKQRQNRSTAGNILTNTAGNAGNAINSAASGNWGGVVGSVGNGVGKGLSTGGNTTAGNIVSSAASGAGNAVNSAQNGNWGSVVSGVGAGVSGGLAAGGNTTAGNIVGRAANGAGSAVNAAQNGNMSGVISGLGAGVSGGLAAGGKGTSSAIVNSAAKGAATAASGKGAGSVITGIGGGTGDALAAGGVTNAGNLVGAGSKALGATVDTVGAGGNVIDVGKNIAENSTITSNADKAYNAYNNIRKNGAGGNTKPRNQQGNK